ncbi:hypothetical protein NOCARDAX2BIS_190037 [Nocardioides sp. AX2bis]|nr:hypothetical protein NOCARDAX2BIS_190037 [Nocardioides sp. AX2bis]
MAPHCWGVECRGGSGADGRDRGDLDRCGSKHGRELDPRGDAIDQPRTRAHPGTRPGGGPGR